VSLNALFQQPIVRIGFLVSGVLATVATSSPEWSKAGEVSEETVTLAAGETSTRDVVYEGSHPVTVGVRLTPEAEIGAKVRLKFFEVTGPDGGLLPDVAQSTGCGGTNTTWEKTSAGWVGPDQVAASEVRGAGGCDRASGTSRVEVMNVGRLPVAVRVKIGVSIRGDGEDEPPSAFVRGSVAR
jgi:hypothetical protein